MRWYQYQYRDDDQKAVDSINLPSIAICNEIKKYLSISFVVIQIQLPIE